MKDSYLDIDFNVTHTAGAQVQYVDNDHIRLVNVGHIPLFNKYRLTSSSDKGIEIDKAHVICFMYKLLSSSRDNDDLSIGFHRNIEAGERKLTNQKTT